jgi:hypothetical protein
MVTSENLLYEGCRHIQALNDPIPQIRDLSRSVIDLYFSQRYVSELITVLPELIILTRKTRADHTDILERVGAVLVEHGVLEQTRYAFYSSRGAVARFLFRLLYPVAHGSDGESFLHSSLTHLSIRFSACVYTFPYRSYKSKLPLTRS